MRLKVLLLLFIIVSLAIFFYVKKSETLVNRHGKTYVEVLFVSESFDRIEQRSFVGRVITKDNPNESGKSERKDYGKS